MRFLSILFFFLPVLLTAQEKQVELVEVRSDEGIVLKGVNHYQDQAITMITEISSAGFGLKKLETISKTIPAGGEVEIITLTPTPNRQCTYSVNYSYKVRETRAANETTQISNTRNNKIKPAPATRQAQAMQNANAQDTENVIEKGIVVYSKEGCGRCEYVTNYLKLNEVPFKDFNITTDEAANDRMSKALFGSGFKGGTFTTPVITVDGKVFYNIKDIKGFVKDLAIK